MKKLYTCTAMMLALTLPFQALAGTVTETTIVKTHPTPGAERVDFMSFDINQDNRLSMREVGDVLFDAFDGDDNGKLDSFEYSNNTVITTMPTTATTYTYYDYNSDGMPEASTLTQTEFMTQSKLIRFDNKADGLSAKDFIDKPQKALDLNRDNYVSKDEWQREYSLFVQPRINVKSTYNR